MWNAKCKAVAAGLWLKILLLNACRASIHLSTAKQNFILATNNSNKGKLCKSCPSRNKIY